MRSQQFILFSIICILLFLSGCVLKNKVSNPEKQWEILVTAHRGLHVDVPENSIASIQQTIENNIDIIEVDVRISKDGIPVLMHDETVDRTTNRTGPVASFTKDELKKMRLLYKGKETEYQILTFEEALNYGKGKILFDIDIKTEQIGKIIQVVEKTNASASVFFFDSDWDVLEKVYAAHPDWKIMPRSYNKKEALEAYEKFKPWAIHVDPSFATPELSDLLHSKGVRVWINSLGEVDDDLRLGKEDSFYELLKTRADIIQTDLPVEVKKLTASKVIEIPRN